jgi:Putative F0F1-ATPase subunit (ATPase_gene1).
MSGKKRQSPLQMAAMVSAMGLEVFAFIIIGALAGKYLDGRFGSSHLWLPLCAVAGFLFGLLSCYYAIKSFLKD